MAKTDLHKRMLEAMYEGKLPDVRLNADGGEILDPVPMSPPIGYKKQPSMVEIVRDMVRSERLAAAVAEQGLETFEEADDFDVDDDYDPTSPYENDFEPPVRELIRRREDANASSSATEEEDNVEGTSRSSDERGTRTRKARNSSPDERAADERNAKSDPTGVSSDTSSSEPA